MFRIDDTTAASTIPTPEAAGDEGYWTEGNPVTGEAATNMRASWFNMIQEELRNIVVAGGLTPSKTTYNQLLQAIKKISSYAVTTGSSDAYVLTLTPALDAYTPGMPIIFKANFTNTGAATMNISGLGALALKKNISDALEANDILIDKIYVGFYDGTNIQIINPSAAANLYFASISASVGSNALTLGINPHVLAFRNSTLTNGVPNMRSIPSALSLIVPSGATLGTINGVAAHLILLAIDNDGTIEPAIVNLAGGVNLDETTLISTTAISSSSNSNNVIYSEHARTSLPFRVVGYIDVTESIAGTWATAPTLVQPCGGQALAALASIGYGQTWQNVKASRALGTTYYNTKAKPILISVAIVYTGNAYNTLTINDVVVAQNGSAGMDTNDRVTIVAIIPSGSSYVLSTGGTVQYWAELR